MIEMAIGLLVGLGCTFLVLEPLIRPGIVSQNTDTAPDWADLDESDTPKVQALTALSEIEFDRATGKLSAEDYEVLKKRYKLQAVEAISAEQTSTDVAEDSVEAAIARARESAVEGACPVCDQPLAAGASFCSECGCSVFADNPRARCSTCGSSLEENAKFCSDCGTPAVATLGVDG